MSNARKGIWRLVLSAWLMGAGFAGYQNWTLYRHDNAERDLISKQLKVYQEGYSWALKGCLENRQLAMKLLSDGRYDAAAAFDVENNALCVQMREYSDKLKVLLQELGKLRSGRSYAWSFALFALLIPGATVGLIWWSIAGFRPPTGKSVGQD